MRAQLFGAFSPVTIGMNVMTEDEGASDSSFLIFSGETSLYAIFNGV